MPILFRCDNCSAKLSIKAAKAGQEIDCPKCDHPQIVPQKSTLSRQKKAKSTVGSNSQDSSASDSSDVDESGESNPFEEFAVYDDSELIYTDDDLKSKSSYANVDFDKISIPRKVVYLQAALLGLSAFFFFSIGWWLGAASKSAPTTTMADLQCVVTGSVFYSDGKQKTVDEGAVVMFLPTDESPQTRPNGELLRPGNRLTSQNDEVLIIREVGGGIGSISTDGNYRFELAPGSYYFCVISNHKKRDEDSKPSTQELGEMGTYFYPIDKLIAEQDYHWGTVRVRAKNQQIRSVVF